MRLLCIIAFAACAAPARSEGSYAEHVAALRKRLAAKGLGEMEVRVEAPFVVAGDGSAASLARSARTVRWAADRLEADFFAKRPGRILDVFLFSGAKSYERGVKLLTGDAPGTPFGFYSRRHGALFMNIATGGGTLVHEMVHPYLEADFPNAPPWLNEGLGSLFEQSAERDGRIVGLTNWRLAGLQRAIAQRAAPSFKELTHLGDGEFYGEDGGVHYAAARYLLYYLQEHGKLRAFYRAFRAAKARDPSGYATLAATVGEDMGAFEKRWSEYVSKLTFP
jgi:hypothetical protein